jgi:hypothetical protein
MMILEERKLKSYEIYRDILCKGRITFKQKLWADIFQEAGVFQVL